VLRVKRAQQKKAKAGAGSNGDGAGLSERERQNRQHELARRRDELTAKVEKAESRIHEINELFCDPTFFYRTSREQVKKLEQEQKRLSGEVEGLMGQWEGVETELTALEA